MFARIMAIGFLTLLITLITIVYFTEAINLFEGWILNFIKDYTALTKIIQSNQANLTGPINLLKSQSVNLNSLKNESTDLRS